MAGVDDLAVETIGGINDGSVLGALCVLLILLIIYREAWYWPKQVGKLDIEILRLHEAHDKTRTALLEEVRSGAQALVIVREQMKAQQASVDSLMKFATDRSQRRRGGDDA